MSSLPLHPAFVHVPLGLAMILPVVAIALAIAVWKGKLPRTVLAVVTGLQLLLVVSGFVATSLGHREEKQAALVTPHDAIEEHEEAAEGFVWVAVGVLVVSMLPLFVAARHAPKFAAAVAVGTLVVAGLALNVGEKGGRLVFQHGAGVQALKGMLPAQPAGEEGEGHEHEKD